MAEQEVKLLSALGHEAKEFQEQLAAEVGNTCSSFYYNNPRLLEPIFTWCILNVPLAFQHDFTNSLYFRA